LVRERNTALQGIIATQQKGKELLSELEVLYTQISEVSYSQTLNYARSREAPDTMALVMVTTTGKDLSAKEKEQAERWLSTRLKSQKIKVYFANRVENLIPQY